MHHHRSVQDTEASIDIADAVRGAEHRLVTIKVSDAASNMHLLCIDDRGEC